MSEMFGYGFIIYKSIILITCPLKGCRGDGAHPRLTCDS